MRISEQKVVSSSWQTTAAIIAAIIFVGMLAAAIPAAGWDVDCFRSWAGYSFRYGLQNAYGSGTDYPPLYPRRMARLASKTTKACTF